MNDERLQKCLDRLEIQEVLARYAICADMGDAEGFAGLFTEDAAWVWEGVNLSLRGRAELRELGEAVYTHTRGAQHAVINPVIDVNGDQARSICQVSVFLSKPEQIYTVLLGYYEDSLVRIGGKWLIARRSVRAEHPEILGQGKIGEYFAPLLASLSRFMGRP